MRRVLVAAALVGASTTASAQPTGAFPPASAQPAAEAPPPAETPPAAPPTAAPPPAAAPPVAPAPAPAAAPAPAYVYPPPAELPPAPPSKPRERKGLVGVVRFALPVGGGGELDPECSGTCDGFDVDKADFDEASSMALGGELLFHLAPEFRLGAGLLYVSGTAVEVDRESRETDLGSDLSVMAVAEGVFDVGPTTALTVRGQAGLLTLFPGGDLEDGIDDMKRICDNATLDECDVDDGPYAGFTFGGGPGVRIALDKIALRVDLLFQWYSVKHLMRIQGRDAGGELDVSIGWSGHRYFLSGGLEF